jgi:hypothetical protein
MSAVYAGLFGHRRPKSYVIDYRVLGMIAPAVLVGIARTSGGRWAATAVASIYTALWLSGVTF